MVNCVRGGDCAQRQFEIANMPLRRSAGFVVLLSRVQLEIWRLLPQASWLNITDKSLILKMERVKGIEPSSSAWKDFALSVYVRRLPLVGHWLAASQQLHQKRATRARFVSAIPFFLLGALPDPVIRFGRR
jgi:hypothetical protein